MSVEQYRKEQAEAKIVELAQVYGELVTRYAEIATSYPDAAEELKKNFPGLAEIEKHGNDMWDNLNKK